MNESSEQRRHARVTFFLIPVEREQVPFWVFLPPTSEGTAGVVVNMSESGIQVLTSVENPLRHEQYLMRLIVEADDSKVSPFEGPVRRIWSRDLNAIGLMHGMQFDDECSDAAEFLRMARPGLEKRRWVRCVLMPRGSAGG
jgi:hypothetical protein